MISDPVMDYSRPLLPNIISIGGVTVRPPKPLKGALLAYFNEAKHGVIIVSFGSSVVLPERIVSQMIDCFSKFPQRFLWKLNTRQNQTLPPNMMVLDWMPQRDALSHPNVKIFITHCGNNGQYEALYSGVPMIGLPIFGDQTYNRNRMVYKGLGIGLETKAVTSQELTLAINTFLTDLAIP